MSMLQRRARAAIKKHGGVEKAAHALGVNIATVSMLANGKMRSAGPETLRKFGLRKRVTYQLIAGGQWP